MRKLYEFLPSNGGSALVEFSLIAPLLIFLGVGVSEFGRALSQFHTATTGVRDAARYLSRVDDPTADEAAGKNLAVTGRIAGGTPRISGWTVADVTVQVQPIANPIDPVTGNPEYRGGNAINVITVSSNFTYQDIGALSVLGVGPITINVSHQQRHIGD